jgi:Yersinia/Haemophilus virulence surface antigen
MGFGFESVEKNRGRLTIDKPQQQIIDGILQNLREGVTDTAVKAGLCLGWSAEWIHHNSAGTNFWQWLDSPQAKGDLIRMAHQEQTGRNLGVLEADVKLRSFLNPDSMKKLPPVKDAQILLDAGREKKETWARDWIESKGVLNSKPRYKPDNEHRDNASLARELTSSEGFKLVKLELAKQHGAHATAVSVSGQRVVYMDPNGGEAEFETHEDFQNWFCNVHLKCYGLFGLNDYAIDSFPTSVNATVSKEETLYPSLATRSHVDRSKRGARKLDASEVQQALGGEPSPSISSPRPSTPVDRSQRRAMRVEAAELQLALSGAEGPSSPVPKRPSNRRWVAGHAAGREDCA